MDKRLWSITDHICKNCGGRVLRCEKGNGMTPGGNAVHRCADCGAHGYKHDEICYCGFSMRTEHETPYMCMPWSLATPDKPEVERALRACGCTRGRQEVGIVSIRTLRNEKDKPPA